MADVTQVHVSASVGRIGPVSSMSATVGAGVAIASAPAPRGSRGRCQIPVPAFLTNNYGTYMWQAVGLASGLAVTPFMFYGLWKAVGFLSRHMSAFGWAWISCFVVSFFIALYLDAPDLGISTIITQARGQNFGLRQVSGSSARQGGQAGRNNNAMQSNQRLATQSNQRLAIQSSVPNVGGSQLITTRGVFNDDVVSVGSSSNQYQSRQAQAQQPQSKTTKIQSVATVGGAQLITPGGIFNDDVNHPGDSDPYQFQSGSAPNRSQVQPPAQNITQSRSNIQQPQNRNTGSGREIRATVGGSQLVTQQGIFNDDVNHPGDSDPYQFQSGSAPSRPQGRPMPESKVPIREPQNASQSPGQFQPPQQRAGKWVPEPGAKVLESLPPTVGGAQLVTQQGIFNDDANHPGDFAQSP